MATITEFAALVGVNEGVIRRAIKRGRVVLSEDGSIDPVSQVERWHAMRDGSKVRGNAERGRPATASTAKASREALKTVELRDEKLAAEIAWLHQKIALMSRENVARVSVHRALSAHARNLRIVLENFSPRYAQEIAAEVGADANEVFIAVDKAVRSLLGEIHAMKPPPEFAHD